MTLVVVTGGARSGKSALAQELARVRTLDGTQVTVAVFGDSNGDMETRARIERHRRDRPAAFGVIEARDSTSWLGQVKQGDLLLLDCLGTFVTLVLDEVRAGSDVSLAARLPVDGERVSSPEADTTSQGDAEQVERRIDDVLDRILAREGDAIVVTNEVGDGVIPAYAAGRVFRDVLGRANRRLVAAADAAYLVVCGRAIDLTSARARLSWPQD
jgi:adenosyl cobinamide kinase/adenosyl cobinamide phosphate guanylyltransferase